MAVYPPGDHSPPPPKDESQPESRTDTDETLVQSPEVWAAQEKVEKTRRWPRWQRWHCWGFAKKAPQGADNTKKSRGLRSIMGRFGSLFKKSEKEKPESNPYAQQPPAAQSPAQSSPPPQYDQYTQYNNSQYNDNQSISQRPQGQPSGLPTGPRPGGLPSRVAPGPAYKDEKPPPPQYSPQPSQNSPRPSQYSAYSPSLGSAAGTPLLPPNTSSPSMSTGFPREKYGASDGVGRNRFEPAPSPYGGSTAAPPQRQGGYGNLGDAGGGGLFDNYTPPSRPGPAQADGLGVSEQAYIDPSTMTAEERDDAEYNAINAEVKQIRNETEDSIDRSLQRAREARERSAAIMGTLGRQGEMLTHANQQLVESEVEAERSHLNVKDLQDATGSMFKIFTARQRADKLNEERLRKDLEAREMRDQAKALKLQGPKRAQQGLGTPMSQQTLGGGINAEHRKKFVLEEEDEEQEERMDQKTQELSDLIRGVRQDAEQIGGVLDEQNVLIDSLGNKTTRVHDNLLTTRNRLDRIR